MRKVLLRATVYFVVYAPQQRTLELVACYRCNTIYTFFGKIIIRKAIHSLAEFLDEFHFTVSTKFDLFTDMYTLYANPNYIQNFLFRFQKYQPARKENTPQTGKEPTVMMEVRIQLMSNKTLFCDEERALRLEMLHFPVMGHA